MSTVAAKKPKRPSKPIYLECRRPSDLQRFQAKCEVDPLTGCWNWTASKLPSGYGRFSFGGDDNMGLAHRWSYEYFKGPIPEGNHIDHLCRNQSCVNPAHLDAVTPRENLIRAVPYRWRKGNKTHCLNGHERTPENTYINKAGRPTCRTCRNESQLEYKARRRVA